jgi:hypothetical protein
VTAQPQLLQVALEPGDVVYTSQPVARHIIGFVNPFGTVLDPCRGDGAFYNNFPPHVRADWCEIVEGKDFFSYHNKVDWIIGNPPYSIFREFLVHSFEIADNVVYLVPTNKIFQSWKVMGAINNYGNIKNMIVYGSGHLIGFPFGFSVGAFHFQRGYRGETVLRFVTQAEVGAWPL